MSAMERATRAMLPLSVRGPRSVAAPERSGDAVTLLMSSLIGVTKGEVPAPRGVGCGRGVMVTNGTLGTGLTGCRRGETGGVVGRAVQRAAGLSYSQVFITSGASSSRMSWRKSWWESAPVDRDDEELVEWNEENEPALGRRCNQSPLSSPLSSKSTFGSGAPGTRSQGTASHSLQSSSSSTSQVAAAQGEGSVVSPPLPPLTTLPAHRIE
mmetsp:Transcript_71708/g.184961  ORF Transcript_71708/g.184961 Transcript_71708/m.184961 type:complete len:211 (+) Transcript_71708:1187-1819(+)